MRRELLAETKEQAGRKITVKYFKDYLLRMNKQDFIKQALEDLDYVKKVHEDPEITNDCA